MKPFYLFECAECGEATHPNPQPSLLRRYAHFREPMRWKGDLVPPGGWKIYDHRARPSRPKRSS